MQSCQAGWPQARNRPHRHLQLPLLWLVPAGWHCLARRARSCRRQKPKFIKKTFRLFWIFFSVFFVPFWGFGGSPLFGPNPLKRRRFALPGFFVLTSFSLFFLIFFVCFFVAFWGFGGSPFFGQTPLKHRGLALLALFVKFPFLGLRALSQAC